MICRTKRRKLKMSLKFMIKILSINLNVHRIVQKKSQWEIYICITKD